MRRPCVEAPESCPLRWGTRPLSVADWRNWQNFSRKSTRGPEVGVGCRGLEAAAGFLQQGVSWGSQRLPGEGKGAWPEPCMLWAGPFLPFLGGTNTVTPSRPWACRPSARGGPQFSVTPTAGFT